MTTVDMDRASIELANAVNAIGERYGLTPTALFYVLKTIEADISAMRITEILAVPPSGENEPEPEKTLPEERTESMPRRGLTGEQIREIISEKIKAGEVDDQGLVHLRSSDLAKGVKNDSSDN